MAILIKDIGLPQSCDNCPFSDVMDEIEPWGECMVSDRRTFMGLEVHDKDGAAKRPDWCPLVDPNNTDANGVMIHLDVESSRDERRDAYSTLLRFVIENEDMAMFERALKAEALRMIRNSLDDSEGVEL